MSRQLDDVWRFAEVPNDKQSRALAADVHGSLGANMNRHCAASLTEAFGWLYSEEPIGGAKSQVQSLLVPLRSGGFCIVVNSRLFRSEAAALWLVAHEIGHSFFYRPGAPPRRIISHSDAEERFCDSFANHLLDGVATQNDLNVA